MATVTKNDSTNPGHHEIELVLEGRRRKLSFDQAFAIGHQLWRRDKPLDSEQVFQKLFLHDSHCRPVRLLFARGLAKLREFHKCHQLLQETFPEDQAALAARLHDAFVMRSLGDLKDAIRDLAVIAQERQDLPTVCLILGDLWERSGDINRAVGLWRMAARRANGRGPIAYSARHQIASLQQGD